MEIDKDKCVGCGNCHTVCTVGAIYLGQKGSSLLLTHKSCPDRKRICLDLFGSSIPMLGIMS